MGGPNTPHILAGRAYNEKLMTSECVITVEGEKTFNQSTGLYTPTFTTLYDGKCKIRIAAASAGISEREPLGQSIAVQESILFLPVVAETAEIPKDAMGIITVNDHDPDMVGHVFRVKKYSTQSSATQRRLIVEDIG